jgi:hypothetical protein
MKAVASIFALSGSAMGGALDSADVNILSVPMYRYKEQCGMKSNLHIKPGATSLLQHDNVPGAGIDKFTPFETVLKDGFMQVDCLKDYMYYNGDKFGDNKHDYKLGPVSSVSIVHYDAFVAAEDKQPMTQKVCFEFCRTVPNMGFFGIVNGRGCYCTPYFQAMESDSSQCDAVCEGDTTLMCGGKSKSSVFSMHMCASTGEDLSQTANKASSLKGAMDAKVAAAKGLSNNMQNSAAALQKSFGAVGDSAATGLMQDAKVSAGDLVHKAEDAEAAAGKLGELSKAAGAMKDFTDPAVVTAAERNMEDTEEALEAGETVTTQLDKLTALASPKPDVSGSAKQYYPIMYFVDKEFENSPSTCGGSTVAKPIVGESKDGCASACDRSIHSCVGFQYFAGQSKLCFLFSKFKTASYYTGCGKSFLQMAQSAAPFEATCYGKLSKFEGTSLKPDPSGKTDFGLKKLTKADRCYK